MSSKKNRSRTWLTTVALLAALHPMTFARAGDDQTPIFRQTQTPGLLDKMLDGPLSEVDEVVFAVHGPTGWHWYETFGYVCDNPKARKYGRGPGMLARIDLRTREVTPLLEDQGGSMRDPDVHWDGQRMLFSYRRGGSDHYNLYEIGADGEGLRQITTGPWDDIEGVYLPDGGIMFCSSRSKRWVPCFTTQVANLYRVELDGSAMRQISSNVEHDNTPWVLPDGRVLYTRWEYVMRGVMAFHHLWTMNPDGTGQMVHFGNMHEGTLLIDAKPIPGSDKICSIVSPWHGGPEHNGAVGIVDPQAGPDDLQAIRIVNPPNTQWKEPDWRKEMKAKAKSQGGWRDPYPITEDCFLVAYDNHLCVMDGKGRFEIVHSLPNLRGAWLHEPRPLMARARPPAIPDRTDPAGANGTLVLQDVYRGRQMSGLKRGTIKKLLIVEELPKPVSFSDVSEPVIGQHNLERTLGTVPVEADGSAYFEAPANRSLVFLALDANDRCVKPMRSFVTVMPGETLGCVGCHERRTLTPFDAGQQALDAVKRPPSLIEPLGLTRHGIIDWHRDVQPILDQHCLSCHNPEKRKGGVTLTGDRGQVTTFSYEYLQKYYDQGGSKGMVAPYGAGSGEEGMLRFFDGRHHDVRATPRQLRLIKLWLDTGGTWAGTYAALSSGMLGAGRRSDTHYWNPTDPNVLAAEIDILSRRCDGCHKGQRGRARRTKKGVLQQRWGTSFPVRVLGTTETNLTRPDLSLVLRAPLARAAGGLGLCKPKGRPDAPPVFASIEEPDYQRLRRICHRLSADLREATWYAMDRFKPNVHYIREMKRYGVLDPSWKMGDPIDPFEVDDRYYRLFWHRPRSNW